MNNRLPLRTFFRFSASVLFFSTMISACDGGSKSQTSAPTASVTSTSAVTLSGQIRDDAGFFETGTLTASDVGNKQVARTDWRDKSGLYSIEIPAGTGFPVLLTAKAKREGSKAETLITAVLAPGMTKHDITPNSTKVAKKAKSLGGYTPQNMMQATLDTVNRPKGDRTVGGFRGDPTKQFGGWH